MLLLPLHKRHKCWPWNYVAILLTLCFCFYICFASYSSDTSSVSQNEKISLQGNRHDFHIQLHFIIYSYLIISTDQNHKCDPSLQHSKALNEGNDVHSSSLRLMTQKHRLQLIGRQPVDRFSNVLIKSS